MKDASGSNVLAMLAFAVAVASSCATPSPGPNAPSLAPPGSTPPAGSAHLSADSGGIPVADAASMDAAAAEPALTVPAGLAESVNLFARDLHRELGKEKGNVFYSPLSIHIALSMTWAGARGKTAEQVAKVLHLDSGDAKVHGEYAKLIKRLGSQPAGGAPEISIANRLWADKTLELAEPFVALTRDQYGAAVEKQDFQKEPEAARQVLNHWVQQQTRERVKNLLPERSVEQALLVLTNAIYFKGAWQTPFRVDKTRDMPFYVDGKRARAVPMMHEAAFRGRYAKIAGAQVLELRYKAGNGPKLAMVVILPERRDGISALEREYAQSGIGPFVEPLQQTAVELFLPRFSAELPFRLSDVLKRLGMIAAFEDADFSGIARGPTRAKIREVHHKAFVLTNEAGSEAAAATAVVVQGSDLLGVVPIFRVDHPFLLAIRDLDSGVVLFAGRVVDPGP